MRKTICKAMCTLGAEKLLKTAKSSRLRILMYHRVAELTDKNVYDTNLVSATPENFREQMQYLKDNYNVVSFEGLDWNNLPNNSVIITFDDGYIDNYTNAFPVMKKLGLPATLFLTVDFLEAKTIPWWEKVAFLQKQGLELQSHIKGIKDLRETDRQAKLAEIFKGKTFPAPKTIFLNKKHLAEMAQHMITFGVHTVTHPIMTAVTITDAFEEASRSKLYLERIKNFVPVFAYPNGMKKDMNSELDQLLQALGYEHAVSCIYGTNTENFTLKRACIGHADTLEEFRMKLTGWGESIL